MSGSGSGAVGVSTSLDAAASPRALPETSSLRSNKSRRAKKLRLGKNLPTGPTADVDCYTCRRRRVRCDRGLPTCRKCAKAGHECAGYKKGFRWVGGIASRGKMMGKRTFDEGEDDIVEEGEGWDVEEKRMHLAGQEGEEVNIDHMNVNEAVTTGDGFFYTQPEMAVSGEEAGELEGEVIMTTGPHITMPLVGDYTYRASIAIPATYSPSTVPGGAIPLPLDYTGIDFVNNSTDSPPSLALEALFPDDDDNDITTLPLISSHTSSDNPLTDIIATTATQWTNYFSTSPNYIYNRARSGQYFRITPQGYDTHGYRKQYTLSLCVEPPKSSSVVTGGEISIASLVDYYVSTPKAAPSMIGWLDETARYYLSYFDQMCGIFLLFDRHPLNPYRELLLSTLHFPEPALLTTILAVAARYHLNVTGHHHHHLNQTNPLTYRPDLVYYNQALNYLNQDLQDEERMLEDTTLASVLFFLFYETMDSGLHTWRVHLGGARKLVELKRRRTEGGVGSGELTHMQAFLLHSIALFDIIGSTLVTDHQPSVLPSLSPSPPSPITPSTSITPTPTPPPPLPSPTALALHTLDTSVLPILIQGEIFCFLACPPLILHLILKTTLLSSHPALHLPSPPEELISEFRGHRKDLLRQIVTFDPTPWMRRHERSETITAEREDLRHHVCAYKCAVIIYLYRTLFSPDELLLCSSPSAGVDMTLDITSLTTQLFHHLAHIPPTGSLYKGAVWPCFIAGTEARDRQQRREVRGHFERLWGVLYCQNVRNGIRVLEEMWGEKGEDGDVGDVGEKEKEKEKEGVVERVGRRWGCGECDGGGNTPGGSSSSGSSSNSSNSSNSSPHSHGEGGGGEGGGGGQDWKGYLKRKGVEWLFI